MSGRCQLGYAGLLPCTEVMCCTSAHCICVLHIKEINNRSLLMRLSPTKLPSDRVLLLHQSVRSERPSKLSDTMKTFDTQLFGETTATTNSRRRCSMKLEFYHDRGRLTLGRQSFIGLHQEQQVRSIICER